MRTWRGKARATQRLRGTVLDQVLLRVRFEIYDDANPTAPPLAKVSHSYVWPLDALRGKTFAQVANLLLNVGHIVTVPPDPPLPGGTFGPDPPPLREVGDQFLDDYNDSRLLLGVGFPVNFGP